MKKSLALITIGFLLGTSVNFASSAVFNDVPATEWFSTAVMNLSEKGIIRGHSDGSFRPSDTVNRAELAVILDRLLDSLDDDPSSPSVNTPNTNEISIAVGEKSCRVTSGRTNGSTTYNILLNDSTIDSITLPFCEQDLREPEIIRSNVSEAYFTIALRTDFSNGVYPSYRNLYKVNLTRRNAVSLFEGLSTDIGFSVGENTMAFQRDNSLIIKDSSTLNELSYPFPNNVREAIIGSYSFSPDGNKLAFGVGYSSNIRDNGEIYIFDLQTESFTFYRETNIAPTIQGWVNNTEVNWR